MTLTFNERGTYTIEYKREVERTLFRVTEWEADIAFAEFVDEVSQPGHGSGLVRLRDPLGVVIASHLVR